MKVIDLMIGDWFHNNYTNENYQVWPAFFTQATNFGKRLDATFEDINIEPIPITSEILEKNGFTKELDADGLHYRFTLIDEHTKFSILYARSVFQWLGPLDFKYVHELQHVLRLCGIKKEIVL